MILGESINSEFSVPEGEAHRCPMLRQASNAAHQRMISRNWSLKKTRKFPHTSRSKSKIIITDAEEVGEEEKEEGGWKMEGGKEKIYGESKGNS